jgi:3-deoxy-D-manno-octulosonate 8-phosphate phosphatase (KDO 8-P phosphatase)
MRAQDLKVDFVHQSSMPKVEAISNLLKETGVAWDEILYMGDDVVDLGVLKRAGLAAAPSDAIPEARALAHFIAPSPGGRGAVREATELVLKAQGHWDRILTKFTS